MIRHDVFTTSQGNEIEFTLYGALNEMPCIVYLHGFKGFKDWAFVPYAGTWFMQKGMAFLAFNFSHNGIGRGSDEFSELHKFERNTFSLELSEALEMIRFCARGTLFGERLRGKLGLMGHSRGGGIALLAGQRSSEVSAVATWSAVSTLDRMDAQTYARWRERGYHEVLNNRTGQVLRMGAPLLKDIEHHAGSSLNILQATRQLGKPLLILHGEKDETVPPYEAESLNVYANPDLTEMRFIPGASHTFGAVHPFQQSNPELELALKSTWRFFLAQLG